MILNHYKTNDWNSGLGETEQLKTLHNRIIPYVPKDAARKFEKLSDESIRESEKISQVTSGEKKNKTPRPVITSVNDHPKKKKLFSREHRKRQKKSENQILNNTL